MLTVSFPFAPCASASDSAGAPAPPAPYDARHEFPPARHAPVRGHPGAGVSHPGRLPAGDAEGYRDASPFTSQSSSTSSELDVSPRAFSAPTTPPAPGVIVYRFEESFVYPNSSILNSTIVDHVKANMRRGKDMSQVKLSDRPWNDPGPKPGQDVDAENQKKPDLRAVVLDFSGV